MFALWMTSPVPDNATFNHNDPADSSDPGDGRKFSNQQETLVDFHQQDPMSMHAWMIKWYACCETRIFACGCDATY